MLKKRISYNKVSYHVILSKNVKSPPFDEKHESIILNKIKKISNKITIHAHNLVFNHFHILLSTSNNLCIDKTIKTLKKNSSDEILKTFWEKEHSIFLIDNQLLKNTLFNLKKSI